MINIKRCELNPLISPHEVKPSREDFKVDGIFNCGVAKYNGEILLLCRVAESAINDDEDLVKVPIVTCMNGEDSIEIVEIRKSENPQYIYSDSRSVWMKDKKGNRKIVYLTSLSHIRIARSKDGIHFKLDEKPFVFPTSDEECWGMEDPRVTQIDDTYYINYTSVTPNGAATSLITTKDFVSYKREGIIFAPENKDVTIFPEKINGKYVSFNRPVPNAIGGADMWLAESPDLIHWGKQKHFYAVTNDDSWENGRIGGGAVPFKTDKGWVKIYHAADKDDRYCLGAFLLDINNPSKILGKTTIPLLEPVEWYEKEGFFGNVVFTCGCLLEDDTVIIYYGAADDKICRADIKLSDLMELL